MDTLRAGTPQLEAGPLGVPMDTLRAGTPQLEAGPLGVPMDTLRAGTPQLEAGPLGVPMDDYETIRESIYQDALNLKNTNYPPESVYF